jgi:hypoxanthine phosphoribosyltransferase
MLAAGPCREAGSWRRRCRTSSCDLWWPRPGSRPELAKVGEDGVPALTGANVLVADDVADTGKTLELVRDFCAGYVAEVRTAVIYEKPRSLVRCDHVWRRTDRWIDFPWSSLPPVVSRGR